MTRLVVLTGPESSGKTSLARTLSGTGSPMVQECARAYLSARPNGWGRYLPSDLLEIARAQHGAEMAALQQARQQGRPMVIADTDLQVIYIWWQERFGPAPEWLIRAYRSQSPRQYLLCAPDLAWQPDAQRQNPLDRERLFALYRGDLQARGLTHHVVSGQGEAREVCARQAIADL